jgi:hypothetical protein
MINGTNVYGRNGKLIGTISNDIYYTKRRQEQWFKKFQGFGISKDTLLELKNIGINHIVVFYEGVQAHRYKYSIDKWLLSTKIYVDTSHGFDDVGLYVSSRDMEEIQ